jgi:hypothetical protein
MDLSLDDWHIVKDEWLCQSSTSSEQIDNESKQSEELSVTDELSDQLADSILQEPLDDVKYTRLMESKSGKTNISNTPIVYKVIEGCVTVAIAVMKNSIVPATSSNFMFLVTTAVIMLGKRYVMYKIRSFSFV